MTVILGIAQKTGKFGEYNRYDSVARKSDAIHKEADNFKEGIESVDHIKTMELLKMHYLKYLEQENIKACKENGTTIK